MKRPVIGVAVLFASGIAAGSFMSIPFTYLFILTVTFLILTIVLSVLQFPLSSHYPSSSLLPQGEKTRFEGKGDKPLSTIFLFATVFLLGTLSYQNACHIDPLDISNFVPQTITTHPGPLPQGERIKEDKVYVIGIVASDPVNSVTHYGDNKSQFYFKPSRLQKGGFWQNVNGSVLGTVYGKPERFRYGDELLLEGELALPRPPSNPGGFDYRKYLKHRKVYSTINVEGTDLVKRLRGDASNHIAYRVFCFKDRLRDIITSNLDGLPPHPNPLPQGERIKEVKLEASILRGILLGDREDIPIEMMDEFIKTGTVHILAISGLHVGLVVFIALAFFKLLCIPRKYRYFLTIVFLGLYCIMTGGRPSVVRATIMAVVLLLGFIIDRDSDILNSLSVSAIALLVFNPFYLFDPGFQLSFLTVITIVVLTPELEGLWGNGSQMRGIGLIIKSFFVSLSAWLGIMPLIAYYSNTFSPETILANLIVIPIFSLSTAIGFTLLLSGLISITLSRVFGAACGLSLVGLEKVVSFFSNIPFGSWRVGTPSLLFIAGYYLFLLIVINRKKLKLSYQHLTVIFLLLVNLFIWHEAIKPESSSLKVTFLDVGHGDAIFIEFPHLGNMLIDGGEGGDYDQGRWVISPFLWNKGIRVIDTIILTHPHSDHVGGLATVMRNFKVRHVLDNRMAFNSAIYQGYNDMITKKRLNQITVREGEEITGYRDVKVYLLHPPSKFLTGTPSYENDNSVVVKIIYNGMSVLLCGDIEKAGIKNLLQYDEGLLRSTVLKVPHHGSYEEEESNILFSRVSPRIAVIPEAEKNKFNLPSTKTVSMLEESGAQVYQTGINGAVTFEIKGCNYSITCYRKTD